MRLFSGAAPVIQVSHPPDSASPPGSYPGKTPPAYSFFSAVTCGAVRQASVSAPWH